MAEVVGAYFILASDVGPKSNGPRGHDGETGTVSVAPVMSVPFPVPTPAGLAVVMRVILAITGVALDGAFTVYSDVHVLDIITAATVILPATAPTCAGIATSAGVIIPTVVV